MKEPELIGDLVVGGKWTDKNGELAEGKLYIHRCKSDGVVSAHFERRESSQLIFLILLVSASLNLTNVVDVYDRAMKQGFRAQPK